ncbi:uncharacterized protein LOC111887560 [Lactuca sativa]|uniref:uncharacterized protein LOC111887560 n=1 Tax=Lactuca sativa TaxID=4236 RepID=UPI000CD8E601|nr:uncharacterized protein LOC111887560 [Lactuca sativa]
MKDWLKSLPPGSITTWAKMCEEFIDQFCPTSKIAKLKKAIENFEQQAAESLYEAWERYKSLLRNCPHNDLNIKQEVSIFYDGVNVTTRKLLDSQGPLTMKAPATIKELISEFSKHSREYHNPRNDQSRGVVNSVTDSMATMMAKLESKYRRMTKMDQTIHAIRVGCENCRGPHLTKDCDFDKNGNWKAQKEWLPYDEYKKAKEEKYKQKARGFYQKEEPVQENQLELEDMLTRFVAAFEKRHNDTDCVIKDQQNMLRVHQIMMKDQRALLRNQQASILNIEKQLRQLAQQVNERQPRGLPSNTEKNPRIAQVNAITTNSKKIFTSLSPIQKEESKPVQGKEEKSRKSHITTLTRTTGLGW